MNIKKESISIFSFEIQLNVNQKLNSNHIFPSLNTLLNNDKLKVNVIIDGMESPAFFPKNQTDILEILELNEQIDEDSTTIVKLEVLKEKDGTLKIYDVDAFTEYLTSLSLQQLLNNFQSLFNSSNQVPIVINISTPYYFKTNLFNTNSDHNTIANKAERLESWKFSSNTQDLGKFNFVPEDFKVISSSDNLIGIANVFNRISTMLSIAFISDMTILNQDNLNFKIIGYKKYDQIVNFKLSDLSKIDVIFKIYQWVYEDNNGNIEDKLGLARNIISRHLKVVNNLVELDEDSYSSIITAYKIYLKENVEKYIETKNKVAEVSQELSVKSKDVSNYISSSFKNNNLTLLSYFISLFIFNSLSNNSLSQIFTTDVYYFTLVVLLISTFYLFFTQRQSKLDIQANIRYFYSIKKIYSDIFDPKELKDLFSKKILKYNINHVNKTINRFSILWLLEILLLFLCTVILTYII